MKEPDKIYIEIDNNKAHIYFGLQPENAVEYIRKDVVECIIRASLGQQAALNKIRSL